MCVWIGVPVRLLAWHADRLACADPHGTMQGWQHDSCTAELTLHARRKMRGVQACTCAVPMQAVTSAACFAALQADVLEASTSEPCK
jgi:hypothetical protein